MLNANGHTLCPLCFSPIPTGSRGCTHCQSISNKAKYFSVLNEGTILAGRYSVGKVLGKGGFGVTYLCYDLVMNKKVAIKEFFPDSIACRTTEGRTVSATDHTKTEDFRSYAVKFYEEAKLVSRFNGNPNVISVYEFFYENDTAYFVMEALEGVDLKQYVQSKGGKIDVGEALFVVNKMLDALMVVHSAGVLHRDISPDNIYICKNGDIKLIDFGAARQVIGEESKSLSVILKQGFAPIEQYQKKGVQGPWTDIYALGATLYYILTGRHIDDAMSRLEEPELDLTEIPMPLAEVLKKMLAVKHVDRFQSIFEVKSAINALNFEITPISIHNFCHMCGGEIPFGENICPQCFAQGTNPEPVVPIPVPEPRKKGFLNKWVILASGLGIALVIVIVSIALVLSGSEEDATVVSTDEDDVVAVDGETTKGEDGEGEVLSLFEKRVAAYVESIKADTEIDDEEGSVELEARGTAIVYKITVKDSSMVDEAVGDVFNEFESSRDFFRENLYDECPEATSLVCEIYDPDGELVESRELELDYSEEEKKVAAYVELLKESTEEAASNDMIECEVEARGTSVVYKFTLLDSTLAETVAESFLEEFETVKDDLSTQFNTTMPEVTSMIYEIYDNEGNLIDSVEFEL